MVLPCREGRWEAWLALWRSCSGPKNGTNEHFQTTPLLVLWDGSHWFCNLRGFISINAHHSQRSLVSCEGHTVHHMHAMKCTLCKSWIFKISFERSSSSLYIKKKNLCSALNCYSRTVTLTPWILWAQSRKWWTHRRSLAGPTLLRRAHPQMWTRSLCRMLTLFPPSLSGRT